MRGKRWVRAWVLGFAVLAVAPVRGTEEGSWAQQAQIASRKGLAWLKAHQQPDGAWTKIPFPGITGLVTWAMVRDGFTEQDPVVKKAIAHLLKFVKPDGGIYDKGAGTMNTAICMMALAATKDPRYQPTIVKARAYLMGSQVSEAGGISPDHPQYGGIGYDSHGVADMQNMFWSMLALHETRPGTSKSARDPEEEKVLQRALAFLQRCQNLKGSNDQSWSQDDGGFIYAPEPQSKAEGAPTQSYGSMTYVGLMSFLYCEADKSDPRVQAAYRWIQEHYTLEENPKMGAQGLYYGYHTFAKAMRAYGADVVRDAKGIAHDWRRELVEKLIALQHPEGYWVNTGSARWMEDNKELVTAYAVLALQQAMEGVKPPKPRR